MSRPSPPKDDDAALFREAIGPVRELPEVAAPAAAKPPPEPRMFARDEAEALLASRSDIAIAAIDAAERLAFRRDEVPDKVLKTLCKGGYVAQDEVDLHHLRLADAERLLREFLLNAKAQGWSCVRIVHGKGARGQDGGSVLKGLVDKTLRQRSEVLAFASAPDPQGGTGAVLALLAQRPKNRR